jgi:hypothetical protein
LLVEIRIAILIFHFLPGVEIATCHSLEPELKPGPSLGLLVLRKIKLSKYLLLLTYLVSGALSLQQKTDYGIIPCVNIYSFSKKTLYFVKVDLP